MRGEKYFLVQISKISFVVIEIFILAFFVNSSDAHSQQPLTPIMITANYSQLYEYTLNNSTEYVFFFGQRGVRTFLMFKD